MIRESLDLLPKNIEAEQSLLGSMLLNGKHYERIAVSISLDHFALDAHRKIYACISELADANEPYDTMAVNDLICRKHQIEQIGGTVYLYTLTDRVIKGMNLEYYCGLLRDKYILRQLMHYGTTTFESAKEQQDSGSRILSYLIDELLTLQSGAVKKTAIRVKEFIDEVYANIEKMAENKSRLIGYSFGIQPIDHRTTGLRRKEIAVIGGRPGQGKTAWALQIAAANCVQGQPVGIFSLEMDRESLLQRIICSISEVDFTRVRVPYLRSEIDKMRMDQARTEIEK